MRDEFRRTRRMWAASRSRATPPRTLIASIPGGWIALVALAAWLYIIEALARESPFSSW